MTDNLRIPPSPSCVAPWPDRWLADAAIRRGVPGAERLAQFESEPTAWDALVAAGAGEEAVLDLACLVSATKPADLSRIGPADAMLMKQSVAEKFGVVPLRTDGPTIVVAASNPLCSTLERELAFATGRRIDVETASPIAIADGQRRVYREPAFVIEGHGPRDGAPAAVSADAQPPRRPSLVMAAIPARDLTEDHDAARSQVAAIVDDVFANALREGASDIHFEPKEDGLLVRFRVDGGLYDARRVPVDLSAQVVRRLKVIANVDIADALRPQDGRASITHDGRNIDLRVSTLPLGGSFEKVVVRILDSRVAARQIDEVGLSPRELQRVKRMLELPEGLLLVTGPTGSGKTSTLYAAVRHVHRADLNIVTVEDPIEYRIDGINQVQVNERARMTFAASLRSILRQDPDVVLVGEMRDAETASIAVKASMTGHLVLSTLHASDALATLDRLYGMDIDTSALAAALKGIIGQRLVRKLCDSCSLPVALSELPAHQQELLMGRATQSMRRPVGCPVCRGTGYRGRTMVAEIFLVTPTLQRAIARRADIGELSSLAQECGMLSMWESGLDRVLNGVTSLYELLDNVAAPMIEGNATESQSDVDALLAALLAKPSPHPAPERQTLPVMDDGVDAALDAAFGAFVPANTLVERPTAPVSVTDAPTGPRPAAPSRSRRIGTSTSQRGAQCVLVVDDSPAERRRIADAFRSEGMRVVEAADGEAALNYARRLRPDLIVAEIALPRLDLVGLLQALALETAGTRVVAYTRQDDAELFAWLTELGAEDVVSRSMEPKALAGKLRGKSVSAA